MLIFNLLCLCDLPYTKLIKNVGTCKDMTWLFHGYLYSRSHILSHVSCKGRIAVTVFFCFSSIK